jgi:PIN domain nuclease of toxin-antitoxin system
VRILLDTHYLIWLASRPALLTAAERALIDRADCELYVSPVSIWEVRLKWQAVDRNGERKGVLAPEDALTYVDRTDLRLAPLTGGDCAAALDPPIPHKDPFDEMLLIHAAQLEAKFLTRDKQLRDHPLAITA